MATQPNVPVTYPATEREMLVLLIIVAAAVDHGITHESEGPGFGRLARLALDLHRARPDLISDGRAFLVGFTAGFTWRVLGDQIRTDLERDAPA